MGSANGHSDKLAAPTTDIGSSSEADTERTPRAEQSDLPEGPLKPEELLAGVKDLLTQLAEQDGRSERGAHLALLYVEKNVRSRAEVRGVHICR